MRIWCWPTTLTDPADSRQPHERPMGLVPYGPFPFPRMSDAARGIAFRRHSVTAFGQKPPVTEIRVSE
ncbi:hypothetical protein HHA02_09170 [Cobetia marina]|nr:hypothetical protein HHA02_09170 [Cobetia marina]